MKNNQNQPINDFHRLKLIREKEGISLRSMAQRMGVPVLTVRAQEEGRCDLCVSDLYRWQRALKVPIAELLDSPTPGLSEDVRQRACLLRLAKTAKSLLKKCSDGREGRLARRMVDQLIELMPELREVAPWPEGQLRPLSDLGRAGDVISMREWSLPELD